MSLLSEDLETIKKLQNDEDSKYEVRDYAIIGAEIYADEMGSHRDIFRCFSIEKKTNHKMIYLNSQRAVDIFRDNKKLPSTRFTPYYWYENASIIDSPLSYKNQLLKGLIYISPALYMIISNHAPLIEIPPLFVSLPLICLGVPKIKTGIKGLKKFANFPAIVISQEELNYYVSQIQKEIMTNAFEIQNKPLTFNLEDVIAVSRYRDSKRR